MPIQALLCLLLVGPSLAVPELFTPMGTDTVAELYRTVFHKLRTIDSKTVINITEHVKEPCSKNLNALISVFVNSTENDGWAVSMIDSSAAMPTGLLTASKHHLGHFDECLATKHPLNEFTGQHCMLKVKIGLPTADKKFELNYGLCVPSICDSDDISRALSFLGPTLKIEAKPELCWTQDKNMDLGPGQWAVIGVLAAIVAFAILCTFYHGLKGEGDLHPIPSAFSLLNNCKTLFKMSSGNGQMDALHGIRALSMAWIVLTHTCQRIAQGLLPVVNLSNISEFMDSVQYLLIWNGVFAVDTFFVVSGLLVAFVFFRDMERKGFFDVPLSFIHRYFRLTAPYAVLITFLAVLFPYFGKGPLWFSSYDFAQRSCKNNWLATIFYISNYVYVNTEDACPFQGWYLTVNMQLYWISPLLLFPIYFFPKWGTAFLGLITFGSAFLVFGLDFDKNFTYSLMMQPDSKQLFEDYIATHMRASPWLVGVLLGVFVCYLRQHGTSLRLSKFTIAAGWFISAGMCLGALYGVVRFVHGANSTSGEVAAYLAFSRLGWGLGIAWVMFASFHGYAGPVNSFLAQPIFQPLAKLSYSVYLVHITLQDYRIGMLRTNTYADNLGTVYSFIGDYVLSHLLAILMFLFIEAPVGALDKAYLSKLRILPIPRPRTDGLAKASSGM